MAFKSLVSAVAEQCQEIKQALKLFPYFETWDEKVIAECCRLSSVLEFPPDSIILDSKSGNNHVVYFVLSGVCKMIHHLRAHVKTDSYGRTTYKLYSSSGSSSSKTESNTIGFTSLLFNENYDFLKKMTTAEVESERVEEKAESPVPSSLAKDEAIEECETEKKDEKEEDKSENDRKDEEVKLEVEEVLEAEEEEVLVISETAVADSGTDDAIPSKEGESEIIKMESPESKESNSEDEGIKKEVETKEPPQRPKQEPKEEKEEEEREKMAETKTEITYEPDHHLKVLEECRSKLKQTIRVMEEGRESVVPEDVKSFFVQVGLFYRGACFGLETVVKDRILMSSTRVKCLRIPRQFLLQHNPSNIWNRVRLFLDLYLPKEDKIFEYFVQDRRWAEEKRTEAERIAFSNDIFNYTLSAEVPYSIRLMEDIRAPPPFQRLNRSRRRPAKTKRYQTNKNQN